MCIILFVLPYLDTNVECDFEEEDFQCGYINGTHYSEDGWVTVLYNSDNMAAMAGTDTGMNKCFCVVILK